MGNNGRQLQRKDEDGLTLVQRRLLTELVLEPDFRQACENAKVPPNTAKHWLATNEAFIRRYDNLLGPVVEVARSTMEATSLQAANMYGEAIEANKTLYRDVDCPECHHEFTVSIKAPNWPTRLRAGETILKSSKVLKDVRETETIITNLNLEERLALARWQWNKRNPQDMQRIPPQMVETLRQKGLLDENNPDSVEDASGVGL